MLKRWVIFGPLLLLLIVPVLSFYWDEKTALEISAETPLRSYADRVGTRFSPELDKQNIGVSLREIELPRFSGANAIWGATGRDDRGHIWIGVSVKDADSARLLEYAPETDMFFDHGDPITALQAAGLYRPGEKQAKIHSKIIQADDGHLYFSSMDEAGEDAAGNRLPTWGSHLWRYRYAQQRWEHLFKAPEGLIAVAGVGRWIYALGYWDHILYQYDTQSGRVRQVRVGADAGHVSRNLVADERGHVYVPRVQYFDLPGSGAAGERLLVTMLVEFDQSLKELASSPLIHYAGRDKPHRYHGIIGFSHMADRSIVLATGTGYLYRVLPSSYGPATIAELGSFHPEGDSYTAVMVSLDGDNRLLGLGRRSVRGYELLQYDLGARTSRILPLQIADYRHLLLYGSNTRDAQGRAYLVGRRNGSIPLFWQVSFE